MADAAFRSLKQAFTTAPILWHYQPDLPLTVEADASDFALGCVLSQPLSDGYLHPLCFYNKKFTLAELNYSIYDKKLLAVVAAFKQWRVYMEGAAHPVWVFSDHKNLEYFSQARTTSRRHARWATALAAFDYNIIYRKGASNGLPDALSRRYDYLPPPLPSLPILSPSLPLPGSDPLFFTPHLLGAAVLVSPNDPLLLVIAAAQAGDAGLSAIINQLQGGRVGESNPALPGGRPSGRSGGGPYIL